MLVLALPGRALLKKALDPSQYGLCRLAGRVRCVQDEPTLRLLCRKAVVALPDTLVEGQSFQLKAVSWPTFPPKCHGRIHVEQHNEVRS